MLIELGLKYIKTCVLSNTGLMNVYHDTIWSECLTELTDCRLISAALLLLYNTSHLSRAVRAQPILVNMNINWVKP